MLELFAHPFSSYCWKVLIALYENQTPFEFKMLDGDHPNHFAKLQANSPQGKFPVLVDGERSIFEASIIIEYLQTYYPGTSRFIPDDIDAALEVRTLDRFFDNYVMNAMQRVVGDALRPPEKRDAQTVAEAKAMLDKSYAWLEQRLAGQGFACGNHFSLADCAAAPSLFYADWVYEIEPHFTALRAYRKRLLERPAVARCIEDARPYRVYFPLEVPNRD